MYKIYIKYNIYIYLNSTCQELSNDLSHDNLTQLYQNLVTC